jgi:hypothetical protein
VVAQATASIVVPPQARASVPSWLTRVALRAPAASTAPFLVGSVVRASTRWAPGSRVAGLTGLLPPDWVVSVQPRRTALVGPVLRSSTHSPSLSGTSSGSGMSSVMRTAVGGGGDGSAGVGDPVGAVGAVVDAVVGAVVSVGDGVGPGGGRTPSAST